MSDITKRCSILTTTNVRHNKTVFNRYYNPSQTLQNDVLSSPQPMSDIMKQCLILTTNQVNHLKKKNDDLSSQRSQSVITKQGLMPMTAQDSQYKTLSAYR